jgi:hypothetical protein
MYDGTQISEIVPFTCLLKNSNKELGKIYEFFISKIPWFLTLSLFWVVTSHYLC